MILRASLPMYMLPGTAADWARLWRAVAAHLRSAGLDPPTRLHRPTDLARHWRDPLVLLSQTCGLPYDAALRDHVHLVGAFDFGLPECPPGFYRSHLVVRAGERRSADTLLRAGRVAINEPHSQSGFGAIRASLAGRPPDLRTGAHLLSVRAVQQGQADIAAIDAVSWRLMRRQARLTAGLTVRAATAPTPAPPLISARASWAKLARHAVAQGILECPAETRLRLGLRGLVPVRPQDYAGMATGSPWGEATLG